MSRGARTIEEMEEAYSATVLWMLVYIDACTTSLIKRPPRPVEIRPPRIAPPLVERRLN